MAPPHIAMQQPPSEPESEHRPHVPHAVNWVIDLHIGLLKQLSAAKRAPIT